MAEISTLESLLRRDRAIVFVGLAGVTGLAWVYLFVLAAGMSGISLDKVAAGGAMVMTQVTPWSVPDVLFTFLMWAIMMIAMMVPGAAPMILLFAAIARKQKERGHPFAPAGAFAAGYIAVWSAFSAGATGLQWGLEQAARLSEAMAGTSSLFAGVLFVTAGLYQWTPLKHACLRHCRSPLDFLSRRMRNGTGGAFVMGLEHGAFCVGCCWFLMGLLFIGGVMNLLWAAAIAIFVLLEKALPFGVLGGRIGGALLILAGLFLSLQS